MWPDRVSNPGPLTYESDALPTALHGPAHLIVCQLIPCGVPRVWSLFGPVLAEGVLPRPRIQSKLSPPIFIQVHSPFSKSQFPEIECKICFNKDSPNEFLCFQIHVVPLG